VAVARFKNEAEYREWNDAMISRHDPAAYYASPLVRWLESFRIRAILQALCRPASRHRFLEIGCGFGVVLDQIERRAGYTSCAGLDLSRPSLMQARRRLKQSLPLIEGDGTALPFKDGTFDAVCLTEVIEHVPDPVSVLKEASRVMAPGGVLLVTAPNEALINKLKSLLKRTGLWRLFFGRYDAAEHMEDEWHLHAVDRQLLACWFKEAGLREVRRRSLPFAFLPLRTLLVARPWA
jgi:ubiquinone/menaquinone biosynthesis C-methylase UbiE